MAICCPFAVFELQHCFGECRTDDVILYGRVTGGDFAEWQQVKDVQINYFLI